MAINIIANYINYLVLCLSFSNILFINFMRIHRKSEGKPCSTKKLQQKGISTESTLLQNNEERIPNCLYVYTNTLTIIVCIHIN